MRMLFRFETIAAVCLSIAATSCVPTYVPDETTIVPAGTWMTGSTPHDRARAIDPFRSTHVPGLIAVSDPPYGGRTDRSRRWAIQSQ